MSANQNSITGIVKHILPLERGTGKQSGKPWQKQTYVIETAEQYPRYIAFDLWGNLVDECPLTLGEEIEAFVNIESTEFNSKWYTRVQAWRILRKSLPAPVAGGAFRGAGSPDQAGQAPQTWSQQAPPTQYHQGMPQPAPQQTWSQPAPPVGAPDGLPF